MHQNPTLIYKVVVNREGQYSIWPLSRTNPNGWTDVGFHGERDVCLNYIGMVLCSDDQTLSNECYSERVSQLVYFLRQCLQDQTGCIGVLLDDSIEKLLAFSALQYLGASYEVWDVKNLIEPLQRDRTALLLTTSRYVDEADRLLWETESLGGYLLLDEYDASSSEKQSLEKHIWESVAEETSEELNDYGWNSSFGGKAFSLEEMQEYIDNFRTKLKPYLTKESKVFEIGCGHGLVLFHLAPEVKAYFATDLSETIIERNRWMTRREGLSHVELRQAAAAEIEGIAEADFDVVMMSSVVHYFPNTLYLEKVIQSAISLLKEKGILYLDDLLDLRKKQELVEETRAYQQTHPNDLVKTSWDEDLFVDENFFEDLHRKYPEICGWESSCKLGEIENELNRFRYDVVLKVDKKYKRKENPVLLLHKGRYTWEDVQRCNKSKGLVNSAIHVEPVMKA
ncbi:Methyltransferase domain-containing protein [Paenibacillus sophorae]|uniref:MbtH family NRPS accessory protein n=1 Tax=Paenibacillus sophorae TaxID=1333845 RepID=A0A1H8SZ32_9BACL|nr:MbtH family NRPS accessory protein [Paenibacillus sophorae]QWU15601.1 MbtH family NRPS accessory protein [Paenibacillus sophorae]SEO83473.1 Methyltransferase domain-containing protein [Paenibacillus sophorae]